MANNWRVFESEIHDYPYWKTDVIYYSGIVRGDPKKYSCLIKREVYNKGGFFKNEICFDYQRANLNFDILVLIFGCHLAEI